LNYGKTTLRTSTTRSRETRIKNGIRCQRKEREGRDKILERELCYFCVITFSLSPLGRTK